MMRTGRRNVWSLYYRVNARRPVRRTRKTWLESVKADMAKVEIDEEDVQKEMEKECYEVEVIAYRKTDYKSIIIIKILSSRNMSTMFYFHRSIKWVRICVLRLTHNKIA